MIGSFILIIIGMVFFLLGLYFLEMDLSFEAGPVCWLIGLLLIAFGIIALFNHSIVDVLLRYLNSLFQ
jgi:hypothetical protein